MPDLKIDEFESPRGFNFEDSAGLKDDANDTLRILREPESPVKYQTEEKQEIEKSITPQRIRTGGLTARKSQNSQTQASIERYQNMAFNYNKICQESESVQVNTL